MSGEPRFYSKNYLDELATITYDVLLPDPGSVLLLPRLYDRDTELAKWAALIPQTYKLNMQLKSGGLAFARSVDTVFVMHHNANELRLSYWNGSAWVQVAEFTANLGANEISTTLSFAAVTASMWQLELFYNSTYVRPLISCAEVVVCKAQYAFGTDRGPTHIRRALAPAGVATELVDGGYSVHKNLWAGQRTDRTRARLMFTQLTPAEVAALRTLFRMGELTAWLEPDEEPDELIQGTLVPGGLSREYTTVYKGNGQDIEIELRET